MEKTIILLLLLINLSLVSYGQGNQKKIDYHYKRTANTYEAYTVSVDTITKQLFFEVVSNAPVRRFSKARIYNGDKLLVETSETLPPLHKIDDKKLKVFVFRIESGKLKEHSPDCNLNIQFIASKEEYNINMPLDYCMIKNNL